MMYGKVFGSLYTGSMIGAGPVPFALMPYVIANSVPDEAVGGHVELNPKLLATIFGCSEQAVEEAIEFLCAPDPKSRSPEEGGRRLIRLGPYDYRVVNYAKYKAIKDEEQRREQNRVAQATFRAKNKGTKKGRKFTRSEETGIADIVSQCENGRMPVEPEDMPL